MCMIYDMTPINRVLFIVILSLEVYAVPPDLTLNVDGRSAFADLATSFPPTRLFARLSATELHVAFYAPIVYVAVY